MSGLGGVDDGFHFRLNGDFLGSVDPLDDGSEPCTVSAEYGVSCQLEGAAADQKFSRVCLIQAE